MIASKYQDSVRTVKEPLVSILINNYNYGRFLQQAIDSALNQTYSHFEIIVVDDGSSDNSQEIIMTYGDKIIPIFQENGGQASAFNAGFAASRGEVICFLDADDIFSPEKATEIARTFTEYEDAGWCFHILKFFSENQENFPQRIDMLDSAVFDLRAKMKLGKLTIPHINLATSGMCFRRSLLELILPMPETIKITSDDYIKYISLGLQPGFILFKELSFQRIHGNNAYTFRADKDKQKLKAKITILSAYWMKFNFPQIMSKFSNNIFAVGMSVYWLHGGIQLESVEIVEIVEKYLSSLSFLEKAEIYLRIIYNYMKSIYKNRKYHLSSQSMINI